MGLSVSKDDQECPCRNMNPGCAVQSVEGLLNSIHYIRFTGNEISPFTTRIRIALQFKGIQPDFHQIMDCSGWLDPHQPHLEHSPDIISGDVEILAYIEKTFQEPTLFNKPVKRKVRKWVTYVKDVFTPTIVKAWTRHGDLEELHTKLEDVLEKLDSNIKNPYFLGKHFTMVDVYLIPFVEMAKSLKYLHGIDLGHHAKLASYVQKMASFPAYSPLAMNPTALRVLAQQQLEEVPAGFPLVTLTILQHRSILRHMERLVGHTNELAEFQWQDKKLFKRLQRLTTSVQVSVSTKLKNTVKDYDRLLVIMLEHAQMEEKIIFSALENIEKGVTRISTKEHSRDLPMMNGVREYLKTVTVLEKQSPSLIEALNILATKLQTLEECTIKHFKDEEKEILPLLKIAEIGNKQQEVLVLGAFRAMQSSHSNLLPFFLSTLQPYEIHQYIIIMHRCFKENEPSRLEAAYKTICSDDEFEDVWRVVQERVPLLVDEFLSMCSVSQ